MISAHVEMSVISNKFTSLMVSSFSPASVQLMSICKKLTRKFLFFPDDVRTFHHVSCLWPAYLIAIDIQLAVDVKFNFTRNIMQLMILIVSVMNEKKYSERGEFLSSLFFSSLFHFIIIQIFFYSHLIVIQCLKLINFIFIISQFVLLLFYKY